MSKPQVLLTDDPRYVPFCERYAGDPDRFATEVQGIWTSEQQQELFANVAVSRSRTSVASGHGCFALGTPVLRADGSVVAVEDVAEGDDLAGADGIEARRVLHLHRGREMLVEVRYADGGAHVFNLSHRLLVQHAAELAPISIEDWLEEPWQRRECRCWQLISPLGTSPQYRVRAIVSVQMLGEGDYFGFLLDGDGRFLHADGTVLQNTGKTTGIANIVLWHLLCFEESVTLLTANDMDQLKATLWKEIGLAIGRIRRGPHAWIAEHLDPLANATMRIKGFEKTWFVESKTANEKSANKMAGRHGKWLLIIADEAATIADLVLTTLTGALTEQHNRFLLTSQPVVNKGFFYRTHNDLSETAGGEWVNLVFSSFDSPFVSDDSLMEFWNAYDPDERNVRLLGVFPQDSSKHMMSLAHANSMYGAKPCIAADEAYGWLVLSDVASGEGIRDKSACVIARVIGYGDYGPDARRVDVRVIPFLSNGIRSNTLAARLVVEGYEYDNATYVVDSGGLGINVCQDLEDLGKNLHRVNWGNPCWQQMNQNRYLNKRAQAMHQAARAVKEGRLTISVEDHKKDMLAQSSRIPKAHTDKGRIKVPPKGAKEWEGLSSPDLWDAVCFAFLEDVTYTPVSSHSSTGGINQSVWDALREAATAKAIAS